MRKNIIALLLLAFTLHTAIAQETSLDLANASFANKDYATALEAYQKILKKNTKQKDLADIKFKIAESYRYTGKDSDAIAWYDEAKTAGYANPNYLYLQAGILMKQGKYAAAKIKLNEFLALQPNDLEATTLLNNANFALNAPQELSLFTFKNEGTINTTYGEYSTVKIKDKVFFTSSRIVEKGETVYSFDGQGFSDIYEVSYSTSDKTWSKAAKVAALSSPFNDGPFTYCEATKTLYSTKGNDPKVKKTNNFIVIVESTYDEGTNTWSQPKPIKLAVAQKGDMGQPAISPSGNRLYFVSGMEGGVGGKDIWVMQKSGDQWDEPKNAGAVINTTFDEMFPTAYGDSLLYFSSAGHPGYGGLDIFYTTNATGEWSKPVNLRASYNSSGDDFSINYNADKTAGFFTSNRPGGVGSDDIYSFFLTPVILTLKGKVTDVDGDKPLAGAIVVLTTNTGIDTAYTNADGEYTFTIDKDKDYKINVSNPGYFGDSRKLTTQGEKVSKEFSKATGHNYDFSIKKIPKVEIKIDNIYYDYDSYNLREESKPSLDILVKLLEDTPDALVQINSHTDERGKFEYNLKLSDNRAKSVVDYLISKGISAGRLSSKGFSSSQPVIKGAKTEEEHQQNRRTTFQVLNNK